MEDLSLIEDEYNQKYEALIEEFREKLKSKENKQKNINEFKKKASKLLEVRNNKCKKYIQSHKDEMLGLEKKKKKKEEETGVYKAYRFSFKRTFFEKVSLFFRYNKFRARLFLVSAFRNSIPFHLRYWFYRILFVVKAFIRDVVFVFKGIFRVLARRFAKQIDKLKKLYKKVYDFVKKIIDWLMEKKKAWDEKRKKKKEEAEKKKQEAEEAKKKAEEEKKQGSEGENKEEGEKKEEKPAEESKPEEKKEAPAEEKKEEGEKKEGGAEKKEEKSVEEGKKEGEVSAEVEKK